MSQNNVTLKTAMNGCLSVFALCKQLTVSSLQCCTMLLGGDQKNLHRVVLLTVSLKSLNYTVVQRETRAYPINLFKSSPPSSGVNVPNEELLLEIFVAD